MTETGTLQASAQKGHSCNRLIASLSSADFDLLSPNLERVQLKLRQRLEISNRRIREVYFIESGIASVVARTSENADHRTEVGLIGNEGMTGRAIVLGVDRTPDETFVQAKGAALSIEVDALRAVMVQSRTMMACFLAYAHAFAVQSSQTALANARGRIEERLCRWLLMARDRLPNDDLFITHEFMSLMLGVRRAGVTIALQHLQAASLIETSRGCIKILDRAGLERKSRGFYGVPESEFQRLFPLNSTRVPAMPE